MYMSGRSASIEQPSHNGRTPRILLLCLSASSGANIYTSQLANALTCGCRVGVCLPSSISPDLKRLYNDEIEIAEIWMPAKTSGALSSEALKGLLSGKTVRDFMKFRKKFRPTTIHTVFEGVVPLPLLLAGRRLPIVSTIHDPLPHIDQRSITSRLVVLLHCWLSDAIIIHGESLKAQLPIGHDRAYVVQLGNVGAVYRHPNGVVEEKGNVLFFGRIRKYKGLKYLIEATPKIKKEIPGIKIVIAGSGPLMEERKVREDPSFQLIHREINDSEVPILFAKSSLVVLPYEEATQSAVIPLAYSFGKPVVATSVGALADVVQNGVTGVLVPPRDSNALADAIIGLLKDDTKRIAMGRHALEFVNTGLSWKKIAEVTTAIYRRISDERP